VDGDDRAPRSRLHCPLAPVAAPGRTPLRGLFLLGVLRSRLPGRLAAAADDSLRDRGHLHRAHRQRLHVRARPGVADRRPARRTRPSALPPLRGCRSGARIERAPQPAAHSLARAHLGRRHAGRVLRLAVRGPGGLHAPDGVHAPAAHDDVCPRHRQLHSTRQPPLLHQYARRGGRRHHCRLRARVARRARRVRLPGGGAQLRPRRDRPAGTKDGASPARPSRNPLPASGASPMSWCSSPGWSPSGTKSSGTA
jgi:hypothetical protein